MNRKRIIKHTIALIVILLLTAVVEILCFNGNAVFDPIPINILPAEETVISLKRVRRMNILSIVWIHRGNI